MFSDSNLRLLNFRDLLLNGFFGLDFLFNWLFNLNSFRLFSCVLLECLLVESVILIDFLDGSLEFCLLSDGFLLVFVERRSGFEFLDPVKLLSMLPELLVKRLDESVLRL